MHISRFKNILNKYLNKSIEPEEEEALEEFDQRMLGNYFSQEEWNAKNSNGVYQSILRNLPKDKKVSRSFFIPLKIAVSVTLLFGLGSIAYHILDQKQIDYSNVEMVRITEYGQKSEITLSDGTKVRLNSGSKLTFPRKFNDGSREVELVGEAFFEVTKNQKMKFIVKSGGISTTVWGTSFNVNAYPENEELAVTVVTGKVQVNSKDVKVFLEPGQQGVYNKKLDDILKKQVDTTSSLGWKDGILRFENATLGEVARKLSRWYGVKVEFDTQAIKECQFSGIFNKENLQTVLEGVIFVEEGLTYKRNGANTIVLAGKCSN
ncbi:FecR family protein [Zobellia alginiliquefaciens]|uniref:FecR family protein n=1 Tax=Zobellia alginiliquefaciens TaxID=3032586 RepID=UPI0023E41E65|nr:FecR domain-containing protein [Zobellia alginiliquefaciens]